MTASAMTITIVAGEGLQGNAPALNAFNRAADSWEALFSDPIQVTLDADLLNLGSSNIIGQASSFRLQGAYNNVVAALKADAANEFDDAIVGSSPTAAQTLVSVPVGFSLEPNFVGTKANFKALGYKGLDEAFGASDGVIEFNSSFAFDFDRSDGLADGTLDFEIVAAHEIAHALGFISQVDAVHFGSPRSVTLSILDLFRFSSAPTPANFTSAVRSLVPGAPAVFSDGSVSYEMSTGINHGDGRQAIHWKDDNLTGVRIGVMDPTLGYGQFSNISSADIRGLDVIGYEYSPVPEPGAFSLVTAGMCGFVLMRRRPA